MRVIGLHEVPLLGSTVLNALTLCNSSKNESIKFRKLMSDGLGRWASSPMGVKTDSNIAYLSLLRIFIFSSLDAASRGHLLSHTHTHIADHV